jgi:hypothetical protein
MVLTEVEQSVSEHLQVLFAYHRKCPVTLTQLARWSVDTALKLNLLAFFIEPDDLLDRTEKAMRKSLTFLEDPRRYYDERKDPTLTLQGMNQLLLNDNHPLVAQYIKVLCEASEPTIADMVFPLIAEEFKNKKRAKTHTMFTKTLAAMSSKRARRQTPAASP